MNEKPIGEKTIQEQFREIGKRKEKMDDKNKFIMAINEYFGYEVQSIQQFERDLKEDYHDFEQLQEVFNFLYHYERKLN